MASLIYFSKTKGGAGLRARQSWRPETAALPSFAVLGQKKSSASNALRIYISRERQGLKNSGLMGEGRDRSPTNPGH